LPHTELFFGDILSAGRTAWWTTIRRSMRVTWRHMQLFQVLLQRTHSLFIIILLLARSLLLCHSVPGDGDSRGITAPFLATRVVLDTCTTLHGVGQGRDTGVAQRPSARHKLPPHYCHASSCTSPQHPSQSSCASACFGHAHVGRRTRCKQSPAQAVTHKHTQIHNTDTRKHPGEHILRKGWEGAEVLGGPGSPYLT